MANRPPSFGLLRAIGKPPSRRESTVFGAGYVVQIAAFWAKMPCPDTGISAAEAGSALRFLRRTTRFAHRSARCCPILYPITVTEIFVLYFNGLPKCRSSNARDICATFARKQPQLAPNRAVFCCVIGGLLSHMELRRRGASRGRPVLGGSLKSTIVTRMR